ncbi:hypothetical protein BG003_008677 [Podila horticola]|nr:hypothetical protein BG003_008677 [Podila horticola]
MKPFALTTLFALSDILLTTFVQAARPCRPTTFRVRYLANLGGAQHSVKVDSTVNSIYEGSMTLHAFPLTRKCSRDILFCIEGNFHYRYGFPYPRMTLTSKYSGRRYYPEVHVWNERDDD